MTLYIRPDLWITRDAVSRWGRGEPGPLGGIFGAGAADLSRFALWATSFVPDSP